MQDGFMGVGWEDPSAPAHSSPTNADAETESLALPLTGIPCVQAVETGSSPFISSFAPSIRIISCLKDKQNACLCVRVCVHACICVHAPLHVHVCMCDCVCALCMGVSVAVCMCAPMYSHVWCVCGLHVYVHAHACMGVCVHACACMCASSLSILKTTL